VLKVEENNKNDSVILKIKNIDGDESDKDDNPSDGFEGEDDG
jgi:hypothetical protein